MLYTSNGEVRQEFSIVLTARATGGVAGLQRGEQRGAVGAACQLGGYSMDRSMRLRIGHFLEGRATPYLGSDRLARCLICWRRLQRSG